MPISKAIAEHVMFPLKTPGSHIAFSQIKDDFAAYYTTSLETDATRPFNCIVNLMQWLNERNKPQYGSHPAKGNRQIYTTLEPNLMTHAMASMNNFEITTCTPKESEKTEMAAYKYKGNLTQFNSNDWESRPALKKFAVSALTSPQVHLTSTGSDPVMLRIHRLYMMAAFTLISQEFGSSAKDSGVGNVAAILAHADGRVLGWGRNTRGLNSTCHAEVNLIQGLYANNSTDYAKSLSGAVLYTTLKPCRMCAGMIHQAGEGKIEVVYAQTDNGLDAQNTLLDQYKKNWLLGQNKEKVITIGDKTSGKKSLSEALDAFRDQDKLTVKDHKARRMVDTLDQKGAEELMKVAVEALNAKQKKYLDPSSFANKYKEENTEKARKYAEMKKVLEHLKAFMNPKLEI